MKLLVMLVAYVVLNVAVLAMIHGAGRWDAAIQRMLAERRKRPPQA